MRPPPPAMASTKLPRNTRGHSISRMCGSGRPRGMTVLSEGGRQTHGTPSSRALQSMPCRREVPATNPSKMNQKGRRPVSYASVALDIPTRAIDAAYDYLVPDGLAATATVGATVLVPFSGRDVVGYVMDVHEEPPAGVAPGRVRPVTQVLAEPAFDAAAARVARWMAAEYACPLCEAVRRFLAPGQKVRVTAPPRTPWQLVSEKAGPVDERGWALRPRRLHAPGQRQPPGAPSWRPCARARSAWPSSPPPSPRRERRDRPGQARRGGVYSHRRSVRARRHNPLSSAAARGPERASRRARRRPSRQSTRPARRRPAAWCWWTA